MAHDDDSEAESKPWYAGVTLDDVVLTVKDVLVNGRPVERQFVSTISGRPISTIKHAELRSICAKLSVPAYKNKKKEDMAHLIAPKKQNEAIYDSVQSGPSSDIVSDKEIQCSFRLLNILFSDKVAENFASLGNPLTKQALL
jgi:(2Fe-2S) ferredoxin